MFHSLQFNFIENFMPWLRISNLWLLTMGSQGEAKGKTTEMNGSQEAKCLWWLSNIRTKTRPFSVKPPVEAKILCGDISLITVEFHWLHVLNLWLLTIGSQGEAKGLWALSNIRTKTEPFVVKACNRGQNTFREYFFDYT